MSKPIPSQETFRKLQELKARNASVNEYRKELHDYYSKEEWKTCFVPQLYAPWHEEEIFQMFSNYTKKIEELVDDSGWEDVSDDDNDKKTSSDDDHATNSSSHKRKHSPNSGSGSGGRFSHFKKLKLDLLQCKNNSSDTTLERELFQCLDENLEKRLEYYMKHNVVRSNMDFFEDIRGGGHTIKLIFDFKKGLESTNKNDDSDKPFAYTIGAHYWNRECPEILALVDSSKHGVEAFTKVANILNAIIQMVNDNEFDLEEGLSLSTVFPSCFKNAGLCAESVSDEEREQYFGYGNWFYINFADMHQYPCIKIQFSANDVQDIYDFQANTFSKTLYDTEENVCMVKRGPVSTIPNIIPVSIPENSPIGLVLKNQRETLILKKQVVTLHLNDEELFFKTAGMCELDSFKDYIAANPQFNIVNDKAFEYAMWNNKLDNVRHLISLGFNLKGDGKLRTPLMNAVQYGFEDVVKILIENGAPLDDKDCEKWTVLSLASKALLHSDMEKGQRILQYLWDAGARVM